MPYHFFSGKSAVPYHSKIRGYGPAYNANCNVDNIPRVKKSQIENTNLNELFVKIGTTLSRMLKTASANPGEMLVLVILHLI